MVTDYKQKYSKIRRLEIRKTSATFSRLLLAEFTKFLISGGFLSKYIKRSSLTQRNLLKGDKCLEMRRRRQRSWEDVSGIEAACWEGVPRLQQGTTGDRSLLLSPIV